MKSVWTGEWPTPETSVKPESQQAATKLYRLPTGNSEIASGPAPTSEWNLCRDNIRRLLMGEFTTDPGIKRDDKIRITKQREELIGQIRKGRYAQHYADHQGAYGSLADSDLGAYFTYRGQEFVLLGAQPHAQKDKLVGQNLLDGAESTFTVECVERALEEEMKARVKRKYEQNKESYAKFAVSDVRPYWMEGVNPHTVYPHECFYRAFRYATDLDSNLEKGTWLVHGECILASGLHAWVELPDGLVFDGVFQQFYRIEDWEREMFGQAWYKFTPEAATLILANMPETDGQCSYCWAAELKLPWFRGVPLEIDFDMAWELIVKSGIREKADNQDPRE